MRPLTNDEAAALAPTRQMETERSVRRDRVTAEAALGRDGCTLG